MLFINAANSRIIEVVRKVNQRHPHIDLIDITVSAYDGNSDAISFLQNEPLLRKNAQRFLSKSTDDKEVAYKKYLFALSHAQMHLNREGNEYSQLKLALIINFAKKSRSDYAFSVSRDIAHELYIMVDAQAETNFLNYLIDKLTDIAIAKMKGQRVVISDIDFELNSGENGFILTDSQVEKITNLFREAASLLQVKKKNH